ncbi:MAG: DeoR/GlpR transcriptional regulator [Clostridia bacterium]|nr:DeoR/GlpR transcriptional regulator [Clostridia bacterium]
MTNVIDTLSILDKKNVCVYSTGGVVSATNRSVLIGSHAQQMISKFNADVCFFSALAVDENGDIYDCFEEENFIRQAMIEHSSKRVFLCDHTKFGKKAAYKLCSLNNVDLIISDQMPNFNLLGATAVVIE